MLNISITEEIKIAAITELDVVDVTIGLFRNE